MVFFSCRAISSFVCWRISRILTSGITEYLINGTDGFKFLLVVNAGVGKGSSTKSICKEHILALETLAILYFDASARTSMPCKRLGAQSKGFFMMASNSLWSEYTGRGRPKVYWCHFSSAKTIASISFSMVAYLVSVSLRALLA